MIETVFGTWPINDTTQLRVSIQQWHGRWALDIRRYWIKPGGESFTTNKLGTKIYMDMLLSFLAAVIEASREVDRREASGFVESADDKGRRSIR